MSPRAKTLGALAMLSVALPANAAITGVALLRSRLRPARRSAPAETAKTVMLSGGKMTKCLALARAFHRAGHRVVMVETARYRLTGHRFSRAVDAFHVVPDPGAPGYADALAAIVRREGVDVYVPVCSPAASVPDAEARAVLEPLCEVIHADAETVRTLDDKFAFSELADSVGLAVPEHHRIEDAAELEGFDFAGAPGPFVLKSIPYDPVHRLDLTPLPRPSAAATAEFARSRPISPTTPWVMQGFVAGREYCTHSTVRDGRVQVFCCCESSPFQINYEEVDKPAIEAWVRGMCAALGVTGQLSFDFIEDAAGRPYAIECNPRTHSAITMFYDHPGLARAYLEDGAEPIRPLPGSRPTYWLYHELWRLLRGDGDRRAALRRLRHGTDAIFSWDDPLPFLAVHHLQIPALLLASLRSGREWVRIDFNIGKLVEPAGD